MRSFSFARVPSAFPASVLSALLAGCAGLPVSPEAQGVAAEELQAADAAGLSLAEAGIASLDDDVRAFLAAQVSGGDDSRRLRSLLEAVIENPRFHVEYDEQTRSASETFRAMRGNCLSFTNLFVGLAREVGLDVSYQEVEIPPTWSLHGDDFVLSRHVNAVVRLRGRPSRVVDFNMAEFRLVYPRRPISDERAAAHYYSNLGVERMQAGERVLAREHFQRALALDPSFAQAWVNLGIWYQREREPGLAEASYLQALRVSPREYVAMSNLASLHEKRGRPEMAHWFRRRVAQYRIQNPYYHYQLALGAYRTADYARAASRLREAIRRSGDDATFHSLLGLVYSHQGKVASARRELLRAVELAETDASRRAYRRKLDLLGARSAGL